ncbi:MAG: peroxidase family protein [Thalassobaculum sp.]|uniref:peroxidase family protein n=1 Tax=Thalassobaculum sp. TaxID=2022740 RepID=UPI0032EB7F75
MTQATAAGVASSNAFGPADPADLFHGYGHDGNVIRIDDDRLPDREGPGHRHTLETLERLARRMTFLPNKIYRQRHCVYKSDENVNIPAGYTYLAQLVAHDLVAHVAPVPDPDQVGVPEARNFRTQRLFLETIYGGGPLIEPGPYAVPGEGMQQRTRLRLGRVAIPEQGRDPGPWSETLVGTDHPARDIPRTRCPFVTEPVRPGLTDAMVADPRNDDHLIISQLTALFHELHNIVLDRTAPSGPVAAGDRDGLAYRHFIDTRRIVALVYRRIVVHDLLRRLLDKEVFSGLETALMGLSVGQPSHPLFGVAPDTRRVPVEFSHAVFRFAHSMIRPDYVLNDQQAASGRRPRILELLDRSSGRSARLTPIAVDWLIDWKYFFETDENVRPNLSRRIGPDVGAGTMATSISLFGEDAGSRHGIYYRDLVRGVGTGLRSVESLIANLPAGDKVRSNLLLLPDVRRQEIKEWLDATGYEIFAGADEIDAVAKNPPLYLFTLFEAARDKCGERLGTLGSTIVAGVMLSALRPLYPVLEGSAAVTGAAGRVFDGDVPQTMPELIAFVEQDRVRRGEPSV